MVALLRRWAFLVFVASSLTAVAVSALPFLPAGDAPPPPGREGVEAPLPPALRASMSVPAPDSGGSGSPLVDAPRPVASLNWSSFTLVPAPSVDSAIETPRFLPAPGSATIPILRRPPVDGVSPSAPLALRI